MNRLIPVAEIQDSIRESLASAHATGAFIGAGAVNNYVERLKRDLEFARVRLADVQSRRQTNHKGVGLFPWLAHNEARTARRQCKS